MIGLSVFLRKFSTMTLFHGTSSTCVSTFSHVLPVSYISLSSSFWKDSFRIHWTLYFLLLLHSSVLPLLRRELCLTSYLCFRGTILVRTVYVSWLSFGPHSVLTYIHLVSLPYINSIFYYHWTWSHNHLSPTSLRRLILIKKDVSLGNRKLLPCSRVQWYLTETEEM